MDLLISKVNIKLYSPFSSIFFLNLKIQDIFLNRTLIGNLKISCKIDVNIFKITTS